MVETEFKIDFKTVESGNKTAAIIVAAGTASRMGGVDKQLLTLADMPVIVHSLLAFQNSIEVDNIVLVTRKESVLKMQHLATKYKITKLTDIVLGGDSRAQSVLNGITVLDNDTAFVLIHDGARPLVTTKIIKSTKNTAELYGAAIPVVPIKDTLKIVDSCGKVVSTPKRSELVLVQTPQCFKVAALKGAIASFKGNFTEITDEASLIELAGGSVYTVSGSYKNIKITTPEDIPIAQSILKNRGESK